MKSYVEQNGGGNRPVHVPPDQVRVRSVDMRHWGIRKWCPDGGRRKWRDGAIAEEYIWA